MLQRLPLSIDSKRGKKRQLNPPPWYYSSDFLNIEFWSDPSIVAATLPDGLDPDPSAAGHVQMRCSHDWQFSGSNEEFLEPERYQYRGLPFVLLVTLLKAEAGFLLSLHLCRQR